MVEEWLAERLVTLSSKDKEDVDGVVPYLLGIQDEKDRREFVEGFIEQDGDVVDELIEELTKRLAQESPPKVNNTNPSLRQAKKKQQQNTPPRNQGAATQSRSASVTKHNAQRASPPSTKIREELQFTPTVTINSSSAPSRSLGGPIGFNLQGRQPQIQYTPARLRNSATQQIPTWGEEDPPLDPLPSRAPKKKKEYKNTGDLCLSMWQPWASLLVYGIKKVEGRGWYSEHRGRLWIHAASRETSREEIESVEWQYKDCTIPFPTVYPTSALLGCVDVVDMLSQEEYQARYPEDEREENASEYLFVCENPQRLAMPFALSGDHKIWRLPANVASVAEKGLM